jgi:hypothetical protein
MLCSPCLFRMVFALSFRYLLSSELVCIAIVMEPIQEVVSRMICLLDFRSPCCEANYVANLFKTITVLFCTRKDII